MNGYSLIEGNYFENAHNPVTSRDSDAVGYWELKGNNVASPADFARFGITWAASDSNLPWNATDWTTTAKLPSHSATPTRRSSPVPQDGLPSVAGAARVWRRSSAIDRPRESYGAAGPGGFGNQRRCPVRRPHVDVRLGEPPCRLEVEARVRGWLKRSARRRPASVLGNAASPHVAELVADALRAPSAQAVGRRMSVGAAHLREH